jgi:hypothetical protein
MREKMKPDWEKQLIAASERDSEEKEIKFLSLVDEAENNVDLSVAKTLLKTYTNKPDYGTQERVESVLATANPEIQVRAVLEEMPRLVLEAPEWAETLLGQELEHRSSLVVSLMNSLPQSTIAVIRTVASKPGFASFYENARLLKPSNA